MHGANRALHLAVACRTSSGIHLTLAKAYLSHGMHVVMGENDEVRLSAALLTVLHANTRVGRSTSTGAREHILNINVPGVVNGRHRNVSKAPGKVYTENLAHELRPEQGRHGRHQAARTMMPGETQIFPFCTESRLQMRIYSTCRVGAESGKPKPDGALTPKQTVECLLKKAS
ncbi:hypothetical protein K437DRAFT_262343 [Tilletiaria anomala UBC 951]|uniref:Uncharacterized protein n=1 Tax=Tilletiaria anomala (strain ATCC 24038 / CBS 436.72 / UBC 951) TaxID=1037660 RepID=A0A066W2M6_TILAU|nr:uncharacterized protein K437DRAFT_262343 [Tilletiaria anomala UBC 951]KDN47961.1 hypothetical protein K437DRAFT_262343 [Tilletiaria anomala UBC 951]